jgi:hypothetical protein
VARHATLLLAHGEVERQVTAPKDLDPSLPPPTPVVHLIARELERLDIPSGTLHSYSRDFH